MTDLPAPLVPPDCDLRGLSDFRLDVDRLLSSELMAISTGDEFKAAVRLWCHAWKQVPAASLPNDERVLASFAGLPVARWRKLRNVAMRGFHLCSDGRLYHATLAAEALRASASKARYETRREADRKRLEKWRQSRAETADETRFVAEVPSPSPVPEERTSPPPSGAPPSEGEPSVPELAQPKRGTRLPAGWTLSPELRAWAVAEGLPDPDREAAKFRDFWHAKAGKDGVKLDWDATWRTWVRKAIDWNGDKRNGQAEQAQRGNDDSLLARTKALLAERDARLGAGDPDRAADAVLPAVPGGR